jgi:hypothetical protein
MLGGECHRWEHRLSWTGVYVDRVGNVDDLNGVVFRLLKKSFGTTQCHLGREVKHARLDHRISTKLADRRPRIG